MQVKTCPCAYGVVSQRIQVKTILICENVKTLAWNLWRNSCWSMVCHARVIDNSFSINLTKIVRFFWMFFRTLLIQKICSLCEVLLDFFRLEILASTKALITLFNIFDCTYTTFKGYKFNWSCQEVFTVDFFLFWGFCFSLNFKPRNVILWQFHSRRPFKLYFLFEIFVWRMIAWIFRWTFFRFLQFLNFDLQDFKRIRYIDKVIKVDLKFIKFFFWTWFFLDNLNSKLLIDCSLIFSSRKLTRLKIIVIRSMILRGTFIFMLFSPRCALWNDGQFVTVLSFMVEWGTWRWILR